MPSGKDQLDCGTHSSPQWLRPGPRDTNSSKLLLHLDPETDLLEKGETQVESRESGSMCIPMEQLPQLRLKSVGSGEYGCGRLSVSCTNLRLSHSTPSLIASSKVLNNT